MSVEEPFVHITPRTLSDDVSGRIEKDIETHQSGELPLRTAYVFALADMSEIAGFIVQYGQRLDLPAMKAKHSIAIRKVGGNTDGHWKLEIDGKFLGNFSTKEEAETAYKFWRDQ